MALLDGPAFEEFMTTKKTLKWNALNAFNEEIVPNPLYKMSLTSQLDASIDSFETLDAMFEAAQRSVQGKLANMDARTCPIDLYVDYSRINPKSTRSLKIHQLVQLCTGIRKWYGNELVFQLESANDGLVQLITGVKNIHASLLENLVFNPISTVAEINEKIRKAMMDSVTESNAELHWTTFTTDANVFDAADNKNRPDDDMRPTGPVFAEFVPYQIDLQGLVAIKGETQTGVKVTITDSDGTVHNLTIPAKNTTKYFSKKYIANRLNTQVTKINHLGDLLTTFSEPLQLAIKRAGDWGQVENALKYNKIFVTSDRIAALYAAFRQCRFIFLRREEHFNTDMKSDYRQFLRYTFILGRNGTH